MPHRSFVSSSVLSALAAVSLLTAPTAVQAQSLIDFLWGGSKEWGGEKQSVSFDPKYTPGQIIVSFGDRRLYLITGKGRAVSYPIAVPREKSRWQGTTKITAKRENPSWRPTPEMLSENPKLPTWVPGGHPMNPLGVRALYLGASAYRIHGTDAPWTIGQAVSQGCIRMFNKDVLDLYPRIPVGMRVTVTWERFATNSIAASAEDDTNFDNIKTPFALAPQTTGPVSAAAIDMPVEKPARLEKAKKPEVAAKSEAAKPEASKPAVAAKSEATPKQDTPEKVEKAEEPKKVKTALRAPEPTPTAEPKQVEAAPHAAAISEGTKAAIEAAKRAAETAAKAAEAAREAAEAAKKAAEDAKKASSSTTSSEPSKAPAKRAAL